MARGIVLADRQGADAGAMTQKTRGKDAGIVEHQAIAGAQKSGQLAEHAIFPAAFAPIHDEHARGCAVGQRLLGD